MLGWIGVGPSLRNSKAVDLANMLLEATADIERTARFYLANHCQYVGAGDAAQIQCAKKREGIVLESRQQA